MRKSAFGQRVFQVPIFLSGFNKSPLREYQFFCPADGNTVILGKGVRRVIACWFVLFSVAAGASEFESELLAPDRGMDFLRRVARTHTETLAHLQSMRLEYRRTVREVRFHQGDPYLLESEVVGAEIHTPVGAYYDATYKQKYPQGNPGGFSTRWSKSVVLDDSYLASWTEGMDIAHA